MEKRYKWWSLDGEEFRVLDIKGFAKWLKDRGRLESFIRELKGTIVFLEDLIELAERGMVELGRAGEEEASTGEMIKELRTQVRDNERLLKMLEVLESS